MLHVVEREWELIGIITGPGDRGSRDKENKENEFGAGGGWIMSYELWVVGYELGVMSQSAWSRP